MIGHGVLSESIQDYLKVIYDLTLNGHPTGTMQIAERLSVMPPSVTNMLQRLAGFDPPLVDYQKHQGVRLTEPGRQAALRTIRRHRLIELFLVDTLGYSWDEVHEEAERLEHAVSPKFEDRLAALLGDPEFDPHGDPIPGRDLSIPETRLVSLDQMEAGQRGIVRQVRNSQPGLLRYLEEQGLALGAKLRVTAAVPFDRTVHLKVEGVPEQRVLGLDLATLVQVERLD